MHESIWLLSTCDIIKSNISFQPQQTLHEQLAFASLKRTQWKEEQALEARRGCCKFNIILSPFRSQKPKFQWRQNLNRMKTVMTVNWTKMVSQFLEKEGARKTGLSSWQKNLSACWRRRPNKHSTWMMPCWSWRFKREESTISLMCLRASGWSVRNAKIIFDGMDLTLPPELDVPGSIFYRTRPKLIQKKRMLHRKLTQSLWKI